MAEPLDERDGVKVYAAGSALFARMHRTVSTVCANQASDLWARMQTGGPATMYCLGAYNGWVMDTYRLREPNTTLALSVVACNSTTVSTYRANATAGSAASGGGAADSTMGSTVVLPCRLDENVVQLRARIYSQLHIAPWRGTLATAHGVVLAPAPNGASEAPRASAGNEADRLSDGNGLSDGDTDADPKTLADCGLAAGDFVVLKIPEQLRFAVRTLTGRRESMAASAQCSVATLKLKLQAVTGLPSREQRLVFRGREVGDDKTLADLGVKNDDTLDLIQRLRGGMHHMSGLLIRQTYPTCSPLRGGGAFQVHHADPTLESGEFMGFAHHDVSRPNRAGPGCSLSATAAVRETMMQNVNISECHGSDGGVQSPQDLVRFLARAAGLLVTEGADQPCNQPSKPTKHDCASGGGGSSSSSSSGGSASSDTCE